MEKGITDQIIQTSVSRTLLKNGEVTAMTSSKDERQQICVYFM